MTPACLRRFPRPPVKGGGHVRGLEHRFPDGTSPAAGPLWLTGATVLATLFQRVLLLAMACGAVLQFLVEHAMHRVLYHRPPPQAQNPFNRPCRDHVGHHEFSTDPHLLTGGSRWFAVVFALASAELHRLAHVNLPKGRLGRRVTCSHPAHHCQDHRAAFHVSVGMGWIDGLFGTAHDPQTARARHDRETMMSPDMDPHDLRLVHAHKVRGRPEHRHG